MKKSSFIAMLLGTISTVLFALGVCMTLVAQWHALLPGVILGCTGLLLGLITWIIWRKMEHKVPIRFSAKAWLSAAIGIAGALALGVGMCFTMVWDKMTAGILIGLVGIAALLCLIPITKGIRK